MNNIYKLQPLTYSNYLELASFIDNHNYIEKFWSPIAMLEYKSYGLEFYFHILEDEKAIIFYGKGTSNRKWKISTSFYTQDFSLDLINKIISEDLQVLNNNLDREYKQISKSMIIDWKLDKNSIYEMPYVSNYVYKTEAFKTFAGKKLQKKRNHLNYFLLNNQNVVVKNIKELTSEQILAFCIKHMTNYSQKYNESEIESYKHIVNDDMKNNTNFVGVAIYIENQLEALTLCYLRKDICEVIIEKANKEIRGLYQFLIRENLLFNNINQEYMDRQDDYDLDYLTKSKMSYYPIITERRYSSKK